MTTYATPAGGGSALMNEMIAAMATKKSQNDMQLTCHFDFYFRTKKNDPRMITDIGGIH